MSRQSRWSTCECCGREYKREGRINWRAVRFCPECKRNDPEVDNREGMFLTHAGMFYNESDEPTARPETMDG